MFVSMWMSTDVLTTHPHALLADVVDLMGQRKIRRLPVMKSPGDATLIGIIAARDVLNGCAAGTNPFVGSDDGADPARRLREDAVEVIEVMTRDPVTTSPDTPIEAVAEIMRDRKIGGLPVMHNDALVGLITESDIFGAFASLFGANQPGARITFDISAGEDVFPLVSELVLRHQLRLVSLVSLHAHRQPMCVVSVAGNGVDDMLEDVWKSHHKVKHVLRRD